MSAIDPAKAVDAMTRLEEIIRGADPEFQSPRAATPSPTLSQFSLTREHATAAMTRGQNVDALLALARRQALELVITLKNIAATMPPKDKNTETIAAFLEGLK